MIKNVVNKCLVSFSSYLLFCTIGWWCHFVWKKEKKWTRLTMFAKGNWLEELFFKWHAFLGIISVHETISITVIHLNFNVSYNCHILKITYSYISIYHSSNRPFRNLGKGNTESAAHSDSLGNSRYRGIPSVSMINVWLASQSPNQVTFDLFAPFESCMILAWYGKCFLWII